MKKKVIDINLKQTTENKTKTTQTPNFFLNPWGRLWLGNSANPLRTKERKLLCIKLWLQEAVMPLMHQLTPAALAPVSLGQPHPEWAAAPPSPGGTLGAAFTPSPESGRLEGFWASPELWLTKGPKGLPMAEHSEEP